MMKKTDTSSSYWREQGNAIYVTATENLSPVLRKERLQNAANCYYKAYNFSLNEDEKVSAAKNMAMASLRTAKLEEGCDEHMSHLNHTYREAFKYFSIAFNHSNGLKPEVWRTKLLVSAKSCWHVMRSGRISELKRENRAAIYHDIVHHIQIPEIQAECYFDIANIHFHSGITALQDKDFKRGLNEMKECYQPINEAKRYLGKENVDDMAKEIRVLEEDVFMHQCMAESMQAINIGDQLYEKVLMNEETLNMDMLYEVIDWYKLSILRTREVTEVELEAISLSKLGQLYDQVLKMKPYAQKYLMKAIELAHSMHPRIFTSEAWFKACTQILERYQQEIIREEESKWYNVKKKILKEIVKEMKDIAEADKLPDEDFLRFVYREFPPKDLKHTLKHIPKEDGPSPARDQVKKAVQKAIIHFHPDKVDTDKHGLAWKVLSEEITMLLTRRYEMTKG